MALLGGEFAMIMLVSGEDRSVLRLEETLPLLSEQTGMEFWLKRTVQASVQGRGLPYRIDCVSLDTPGIVHAVTGLLRRSNISIDDLETETTGAPFTGAPLFKMRITCIIPPETSVQTLRQQLDTIAGENDLDVSLRPLTASGDT
jgi:glycine cleavage system transcriptional repressor